MRITIKEIEVNEDKTTDEFVKELQLDFTPILLEVNGEAFYPDEIKDRRLKKGDKVVLIPLLAGG